MFYSKAFKFCCLIIISCFGLWKVYIFLEQDRCLDNGNVWDYQDNRCRDDCLTWNKINGCVKMTAEQVDLFKKCRYKDNNCIPRKVFDDICLSNKLPLNKKTGECDTEFTIDKCNELGEDWIYPSVCDKK